MEHRQRAAGVKVIEIQSPFGDGRGDEPPDAPRAVDGRDGDLAPQRAELLLVEDLRGGVEAQHRLHRPAFGQETLRQVIERRHPHAAADQQRAPGVVLRRESVAETRQQVELSARPHPAHLLGASAHDLVDQRNRAFVEIAHRDRAAQIPALQRDVDELPGRRDPLRVAGQRHPPHRIGQRFVRENRVVVFLIHKFSFPYF